MSHKDKAYAKINGLLVEYDVALTQETWYLNEEDHVFLGCGTIVNVCGIYDHGSRLMYFYKKKKKGRW